jgi:hypothetical protein
MFTIQVHAVCTYETCFLFFKTPNFGIRELLTRCGHRIIKKHTRKYRGFLINRREMGGEGVSVQREGREGRMNGKRDGEGELCGR